MKESKLTGMLTQMDQLFKPEDLAKYFGIATDTLLSWRDKYGMPDVRIGGLIRIPEKQFLRWVETNQLRYGKEE